MKTRKKPLGDLNRVGSKISELRHNCHMTQKELAAKMQVFGVDINLTSLSKLEGQTRTATDLEVYVIAKILNVKMEDLIDTSHLTID